MTGALEGNGLRDFCGLLFGKLFVALTALNALVGEDMVKMCSIKEIFYFYFDLKYHWIFYFGCVDGLKSKQAVPEERDLEDVMLFFDPF